MNPRMPVYKRPVSIIGVDPGRTGAIAEIGATLRAWPIPSMDRGIDIDHTLEIIDQLVPGSVVALEWNTGRPNEVPDFAFRFGLQTGELHALFRAKGFKVKRISSNLWTGRLGLPGKTHAGALDQRAAMFERLYPAHAGLIRGPRGGLLDGLLDALLIAHWMKLVEASPVGIKGGKRQPRAFGTVEGTQN